MYNYGTKQMVTFAAMYGYGGTPDDLQGQKSMEQYNEWPLFKLVIVVFPFLFHSLRL